MKKYVWLFILLPLSSFAQIKLEGKIIDAATKQPIPYVNLECFKFRTGSQSNQDGIFLVQLALAKPQDSIKISCVGYQEIWITNLVSSENITYELKPSVYQLNEVKIGRSDYIEKEVGVTEITGSEMDFFNQMIQKSGSQRAVLMKNEHHNLGFLKKAHFYIGSDDYKAPFRIRIYENIDNRPGADLLNKNLELTAYKKNAWNEFDLSAYQIQVPENGFWIAIEWIANEKYGRKSKPLMKRNADGSRTKDMSSIFTYYGPEIIQRIDSTFGLTYVKSLGEKWRQTRAGSRPKDGDFSKLGFADVLVKATILTVE